MEKRYLKAICDIIQAILKLLFFLMFGVLLLLTDGLILLLIYPVSKKTCRKVSTFCGPFWGKLFIKIMGIHISLVGCENLQKGQNYCIVSNHLSYLDILAYAACFPVLFVSRHDVKYWPLLGMIAWVRGSIFVDRSITGTKERPYVKQITDYLKQGFNVLIFPEGTTSNGAGVMPFKKTIFVCPTRANVPVLPVTLRYTHINGEPFAEFNRDRVCWHGEMTFPDHFWGVLQLRRIDVVLTVHPPVFEYPEEDWLTQNRRLAARIQAIIARGYLQS
ncbi:MAG TPA: 1-acyl-sn-glycerol-3-phosphate acyltransferase [Candidatus Marinimicrobia bacterium]|nr:1-acyl-sn-glycerol-3-phosphate acyltransferase [Candidatus Neomarinimicrobiota bacterium]